MQNFPFDHVFSIFINGLALSLVLEQRLGGNSQVMHSAVEPSVSDVRKQIDVFVITMIATISEICVKSLTRVGHKCMQAIA